jgi:parallel beta-helix repeat protein
MAKTSIYIGFILSAVLLQITSANIITVGYSNSANIKVPLNKDAFPAIQNALNKIGKTGGTVSIESGTYTLSENIEMIGSNVQIKGAGMDKTVLKLKQFAKPWTKRAGFIRARYTKNIKISDMTLDGNKANQNKDETSEYGRYGLYTHACQGQIIANLKIKNFQGYGFDPHGEKNGKKYGTDLVITNCVAENNDWDGFTIDQTLKASIQNCRAIGNGRHGFNIVTGSKYITIKNSIAKMNGFKYPKGSSGCGITVQNNLNFGTSFINMIGNTVENNKKSGFCITDTKEINITNNNVLRGTSCMIIDNVTNGVVQNNSCIKTGSSIRIISSSNVKLIGNKNV